MSSLAPRLLFVLLLLTLATACRRGVRAEGGSATLPPSAELESPLTQVREWPTRFPGQAVWLALWECEPARPLAWPAVRSRLTYLRRISEAEPAWIASEMGNLPADTQAEAWGEVCDAIAAADPAERYLISATLVRQQGWMSQWTVAVNALRRFSAPGEAVLGAAFLQPETQDLFDPILRARRWNRERVSPGEIGGTLTSAEHAALTIGLTRRLAAMTETERARWLNAVRDALPGIAI